MIKAELYSREGGFGLRIKGHGGLGAPGKDLLCAAVSTLVYALSLCFARLDREGLSREHPADIIEKGRAEFRFLPEAQARERLRGAYELTECFLKLLAGAYPNNIELTAGGGRKGKDENDN